MAGAEPVSNRGYTRADIERLRKRHRG